MGLPAWMYMYCSLNSSPESENWTQSNHNFVTLRSQMDFKKICIERQSNDFTVELETYMYKVYKFNVKKNYNVISDGYEFMMYWRQLLYPLQRGVGFHHLFEWLELPLKTDELHMI